MEEEFVQPAVAGEMLGLSISALSQLRYHGRGPKYYKPTARIILYKRSDVNAWIEASAFISPDSPVFA